MAAQQVGDDWQDVGPTSAFTGTHCHHLYAEKDKKLDLVLLVSDDQFYAMSAWCLHMGGPLFEGDIEDYNGSKCVRCPWHDYRYNVKTGVNSEKDLKLDVFETKVVDGNIHVKYPKAKLSREPFTS